MSENEIVYAGSVFNKSAIRNYERAQFVEHLRSQFMPDIPLIEAEKRELAAGDLWDLCQLPKTEENADSKGNASKVASDGSKPKGNNRRNN